MSRPCRPTLLVALALVASCTRGSASPKPSIPILKVAFFQDLSVEDSLELVSPSFLAMQVAVDERGTGLPALVRIDQYDTRGDRATALSFARRVAADPAYVAVVVAPFWKQPTEITAVLAGAGLPVLSLSAIEPVPGEGVVWRRFVKGQADQAATFASVLEASSFPVCLGGDGTPYSDSLQRMILASDRNGVGLRFVLDPRGPSSPARAAGSVRDAGCRIVGWTGFTGGALALRDALVAVGAGGVGVLGADGMKTRSYLAGATAADGTIVTCPCADVTTSPRFAAQQLVHDYQAATGLEPGIYAAEAWDAMGVLIEAVRGGATTRTSVSESVSGLRGFVGAAGAYRFGPDGAMGGVRTVPTYRAEGLRWIAVGPHI